MFAADILASWVAGRLGARKLLIVWRVLGAVVLGLSTILIPVALNLPTSGVSKRVGDIAPIVRSHWPLATHISRNNHSVYIMHDDVDLHFAFYYAGNFTTSSRSSHTGSAWTDQCSIELGSQTLAFHRNSDDPLRVQMNGKKYDLGNGRLFVLTANGSVEQRQLAISLSTAQKPEVLAKLIAEML